jgi:hypothetical protein
MIPRIVHVLAICVAVGCLGPGCKKSTPGAEAPPLEQAFAATNTQAGADEIQAEAARAAAALRQKDYNTALEKLETLQQQSNLTPEQRMSVNRAAAEVEGDLVRRAAAGDAQAKAALDRLMQARDRR